MRISYPRGFGLLGKASAFTPLDLSDSFIFCLCFCQVSTSSSSESLESLSRILNTYDILFSAFNVNNFSQDKRTAYKNAYVKMRRDETVLKITKIYHKPLITECIE